MRMQYQSTISLWYPTLQSYHGLRFRPGRRGEFFHSMRVIHRMMKIKLHFSVFSSIKAAMTTKFVHLEQTFRNQCMLLQLGVWVTGMVIRQMNLKLLLCTMTTVISVALSEQIDHPKLDSLLEKQRLLSLQENPRHVSMRLRWPATLTMSSHGIAEELNFYQPSPIQLWCRVLEMKYISSRH